MALSALLRPHRSLAFPFVVVLFPLLWFVYRDADIASATGTANLERTLALAAVSVVLSYAVAVAVVTILGLRYDPVPDSAQSLFRPSNATLAAFAAISLVLGVYLVAGSTVALPQWFESAAAVVGIVLGWPLVVCYAGTIAVGNALGTQPSFAVEAVLVCVGVALSATWLFVLSGWLVGFSGASPSVPN